MNSLIFSAPVLQAKFSPRDAEREWQTRRIIDCCQSEPGKSYRLIDGRLWVELSEQQYDPRTKKTIYGGECRLEDNGVYYAPIVVGKGPRGEGNPAVCPYGKPGDILYVRETWRPEGYSKFGEIKVTYAADGLSLVFDAEHIPASWKFPKAAARGNVSPLHMPAWAARHFIQLTAVRVERLQDISEADAVAEGARHFPGLPLGKLSRFAHSADRWSFGTPADTDQCLASAKWAFANLWNEINGAESWAANHWVWVLSFKRTEAAR